eukprot:TRINITY_DN98503_c0_g1_i1.p2 TRINITY_DN98503_c0_g1~~TRINITY_DN98503_c0_g1_i1.p2  ORF type:complete len:129 (-),score=39.01 TRINITY_DN98503_c0_g1_i1:34-420(-)
MGNLCPADASQAEKKDEVNVQAQDDVFEVKVGEKVDDPTRNISGKVIRRTTTDVLIATESGKQEWCDIEDLKRAEGPGVEDIKVGMEVVDESKGIRGAVVKKTTTDVCIKTAAGKLEWSDIEDLKLVK